MVKRCTVCNHPSRPVIDREIMAGVSYRDLARQFHLSASALCRHAKHLARHLEYQERREDQAFQRGIIDKLDLLETRLNRLFHNAQDVHSLRVALECIREYVRVISLQEKFRLRLGDPS